MRILIIDNKDSFTYNLSHYVSQFIENVDVIRSSHLTIGLINLYDKIIFSPGPGKPSDFPFLFKVLDSYHKKKSILGICLGHQAIAEFYGAKLTNLKSVKHGVKSIIQHNSDSSIFSGVPFRFNIGHYHSWVVSKKYFPSCLQITSVNNEGLIMSIKHTKYDVQGLQFHPESILTEYGDLMIRNWLKS